MDDNILGLNRGDKIFYEDKLEGKVLGIRDGMIHYAVGPRVRRAMNLNETVRILEEGEGRLVFVKRASKKAVQDCLGVGEGGPKASEQL